MLLLHLTQIFFLLLWLFLCCYHVYFVASFSARCVRRAEESWDAPWQSSVSIYMLITGDYWSTLNITWWCWHRVGTRWICYSPRQNLHPLGNNWMLLIQWPQGWWTQKRSNYKHIPVPFQTKAVFWQVTGSPGLGGIHTESKNNCKGSSGVSSEANYTSVVNS